MRARKTGYIHGIVARGGFVVDIDWEKGLLNKVKIVSRNGNPLRLSYGAKEIYLEKTEKGKTYTFGSDLSIQEKE